jgi:hypothetical protein
MSKWLAWADPLHTDAKPYGHRISIIDRREIPALMRRWFPERANKSDELLIDDFVVVNMAFEIDPPEWANPQF